MAVNINLSEVPVLQQKTDAVVFFVEQDHVERIVDTAFISLVPAAKRLIADKKFTGTAQSLLALPTIQEKQLRYIFLAGLGKKNKDGFFDLEAYRKVLGSIDRTTAAYSIKTVALTVPQADNFGITTEELTKQTVTIVHIANYAFDEFITEKDHKLSHDIDVTIITTTDKASVEEGVKKGNIIAKAVNATRYWVDLPANMLRPHNLAQEAKKIAEQYKLGYTYFDEKTVNEMGMGGLAAVAAGSEQECCLVIMEYKTIRPNAPTLAIVGKGITFDSGGLSLKPANFMETMKEDMSGAAAVIATMQAIAQLKPAINVVAVAPITENLPSGEATKPGDIVCFYNGKTAEIKNTDAEGRLILADALSYAVEHYKLDAIIDLATLTGACMHALGPFFTGLFSQHEGFTQQVEKAAQSSGDYVWRLPLTKDYQVAIKSDVADLCNSGKSNYRAGATQAACFLQHFVGDVPWVHLDIAGTAFDVPDTPYYRRSSATGVGVRLLIDLIMHW